MTAEILFIYTSDRPGSLEPIRRFLGSTSSHGFISPIFLVGVVLSVFGASVRVACYKHLGPNFTFKLTIRDKHTLVTTGPYAIVRHPAYISVMITLLGMTLCELSPGSWWTEAKLFTQPLGKIISVLWVANVLWTATLLLRARKEDEMLKGAFGKEWEEYARKVRYWYIPGVI
jgi:protein-S-isoprenylcysteine O-methyltransferase Ste14